MQTLLEDGQIVMHPFVIAEIALGSLRSQMIEAHRLYPRGMGLTDVHLLGSCLLTRGVRLWSRDASLENAALALNVRATLPKIL